MRKFLLIVLIIAIIAGALVFYLKATTPATGAGVRFPLSAEQRELLASVPASAETFALIPTAAAVREKLLANPITRAPVTDWADAQQLLRSWMIGGADLVIWRAGKQTSYAARLDPFRATLVRVYLMLASGTDARVSAGTFLINVGTGEPLGAARLDQLLTIAKPFEPADVIVIQQSSSRGAFPPMERPAVTTVQIGANDIVLISRGVVPASGRPEGRRDGGTARPRFPRSALIAATFREPPRIVGDLDRILITRVSHLLDNGGSIVLYDVNAGTLLPRPDGLIVAKATPENRQTVERIRSAVEIFGQVRETGEDILLSFDRDSMTKYSTDTFVDALWPSNDWAARLDPKRAIPLLERLGDNTGLRLAAPRIYRSARDLRHWIEYLAAADSIEAAHSITGAAEELRVRIAASK